MSDGQRRNSDFGAVETQQKTKDFGAGMFTPGIYTGLDIQIPDSLTLRVMPGTAMLPLGVAVNQFVPVDLVFTAPGVPTDYTIVAVHDDVASIGGSAVVYELRTGLLPLVGSPTPGSLALAYLHHPGAPTPLSASMLRVLPKLTAGSLMALMGGRSEVIWLPAAAEYKRTAGANMVSLATEFAASSNVLGLLVTNTAFVGNQSLSFSIPLTTRPIRPLAINFFGQLPSLAVLTLTLRTSTGALVPLTPASVTGPVAAAVDATPMASFVPDSGVAGLNDPALSLPMRLEVSLVLPATLAAFLSRFEVFYGP